MTLDNIILYIVAGIACLYACLMFVGMIAIFPYGIPGLIILAAVLYIFVRVVRERLGNKEDDYYEKNIKQ